MDIPKDVSSGICDFKYPEKVNIRSYQPTYNGHLGQIKKAIKQIAASKKPVLYTGGGIITSGASAELVKFAEQLSIPCVNTLMGLGGVPGGHKLFLGMLGMHGTYAANMAITSSDLIIAIGARFDDRATGKVDEFAPHAKIIHVDIDPTSISKNIKVDIPIVGDSRSVLKKMVEIVKAEKEEFKVYRASIGPWLNETEQWKKNFPLTYVRNGTLKPQYVIEKVFELTDGKAISPPRSGRTRCGLPSSSNFLKPRTLLTSGDWGYYGVWIPCCNWSSSGFPQEPCCRYCR